MRAPDAPQTTQMSVPALVDLVDARNRCFADVRRLSDAQETPIGSSWNPLEPSWRPYGPQAPPAPRAARPRATVWV
eukprot:852603-Prymnesium_polylepis.1